MSAERKRDEIDEADDRAFNPRAKGLARYLELEEQGLIQPPTFHYRTKRGAIACGTTESVFTRNDSFAVTCETCRATVKSDEAKKAEALEAKRAKRRRR